MIMLGRPTGGTNQSMTPDNFPTAQSHPQSNEGEVLTNEELPTIQADEDIKVEDIPF
jgi:hypothetical protein